MATDDNPFHESESHPRVGDTYLGDGVYASFDGYHIVIDLRAQGSDRIALEPAVFKALVNFSRLCWPETLTRQFLSP